MSSITLSSQTASASQSTAAERRVVPALIAMFMGLGLIYSVGLMGSETVHNGAHDVRHAMTFPCH